MNYHKTELRNALAAEYVLGTLRGGARRRFKQLMLSSQTIAETTHQWEQYLNGMGGTVAPVAPDQKVWDNIQKKLDFTPQVASIDTLKPKSPTRQTFAYFLAAASIFVAILVSVFQFQEDALPQVTQFAVVNDAQSNPIWLIEISSEELIVRPTDQLAKLDQNDYELWIVPAGGDSPISLGVLPQSGRLVRTAPDELRSVDFEILAVSLEPIGGSPTGQPTEVLFTAGINTV